MITNEQVRTIIQEHQAVLLATAGTDPGAVPLAPGWAWEREREGSGREPEWTLLDPEGEDVGGVALAQLSRTWPEYMWECTSTPARGHADTVPGAMRALAGVLGALRGAA